MDVSAVTGAEGVRRVKSTHAERDLLCKEGRLFNELY